MEVNTPCLWHRWKWTIIIIQKICVHMYIHVHMSKFSGPSIVQCEVSVAHTHPMSLCMDLCMYIRRNTHHQASHHVKLTHTHTCTHTHVHTHVRTYTHMHARTHTHSPSVYKQLHDISLRALNCSHQWSASIGTLSIHVCTCIQEGLHNLHLKGREGGGGRKE